ncbi:uncharacterized protein LOC113295090 [Papaver somniferum]|uniref:uncharacterized protein LOC113295090 n=1 Tax=Papaver somniferum TaxID=3469 RepID=UPI000E6FBC27|nr:uncharacterized protein LOC113295090 [Papaver somniferum]
MANDFFMHIIGDGESTFFLTDLWHPNGRLIEWVSRDVIDELCYSFDCTVVDFMDEEGWYFPDSVEDDLPQTIMKLKEVNCDKSVPDMIVWKPSSLGMYTMKDTYKTLAREKESILWTKLVWFSSHVLKHSFITWLSLHGRLKTRDKMVKWGLLQSANCVLCEVRKDEIAWCLNAFSGQGLVSRIKKLILNCFVYHVWRDRNSRIFTSKYSSVDQAGYTILYDVRLKFFTGGWGAILRTNSGEIVVAAKGGGPSISVNAHELQGVELGLIWPLS